MSKKALEKSQRNECIVFYETRQRAAEKERHSVCEGRLGVTADVLDLFICGEYPTAGVCTVHTGVL